MFCKNCGKENPDGTKFCQYCGTPAEQVSANVVKPDEISSEGSVAQPTYAAVEEAVSKPEAAAPAGAATPASYAEPISYTAPVTQGTYSQPQYVQPAYSAPAQSSSSGKGLAITALVFSIVGALFSISCCLTALGLPMCIAGIIMGAITMKKPETKTLGMTALIVGCAGAVLGLIVGIVGIIGAADGDFPDYLEDFLYTFDY